jgi:hypothetical protein
VSSRDRDHVFGPAHDRLVIRMTRARDAAAASRCRHLGDRAVAGHESVQPTQVYLHADLALKEQALARTTPPGTAPGRYRPPDKLLAFLQAL